MAYSRASFETMIDPECDFLSIISRQKKFPCKLSRIEGEILKKHFDLQPINTSTQKDIKDIGYRYIKEIEGKTYVLLEEYLFRDRETFLDIKRAIGINYYLNRN